MANVNYDTLTIEINADSGKANRSINSLSKSLLKLEDTAKKLDWKQLETTKKYLEDIAKISFDNVSQGLQDVVSAFKALNKEAEKGVKGVSAKAQAKAIDLMTNGGQGFGEPKINFPSFDESLIERIKTPFFDKTQIASNIGEINEGLSMTEARLKGLGFSAEQITNMMSMGQANRDLQEKIALLQSLGLNAQQAKEALKSVNQEADEGSDEGGKGDRDGNKSMGKLQKLFNSIKRIALYRLIRRVIQIIAKAIKEGIENIAKFDKEFNKSMSNIKSSLTYLKNAIGSAFAPIIQMLEPFITGLIMRFAELFNKIAEIASAMQGKTMFTKAKYEAEDFAKSLNKVTMGFDELNVLQSQGGNFEEAEVSDEAIEKANFLKEIIADIKDIIETLKPLINTIIGSVKDLVKKVLPLIKPLLNAIEKVLSPIVNLVNMLIDDTHELVEDSLVSVVDLVATLLSFIGTIVQDLMPLLVPVMKLVAEVINFVNTVIKGLADKFKVVFDVLKELKSVQIILFSVATILGIIVNAVASLVGFLKAVAQVVYDIQTGNFSEIGKHWEQAMSDISNSWQDMGNTVSNSGNYIVTADTPNLNNLMNGGNNGGDTNVNVYVDSEQISAIVEKNQNNRGINMFRGGNLTYGK